MQTTLTRLLPLASIAALALTLNALLAGAAAAQGLSAVRIACERDNVGAEIRINGQYKGDCPLDAEVKAGQIEVQAVKRVDATRERRFVSRFGLGEGVVKRVEVALGAPQLTAEAQRAEDERRRAEAERKRLADEAARKAAAERQAREQAEAARQAEFRRLAALEEERRRRERADAAAAAFQAAGLVAGNGQAFRDCPECPELVWIPPGPAPQLPGDSPSHRWYNGSSIPAPLAVGRFEVTYDEWDACAAQGGCQRRPAEGKTEGIIFDSHWGRGRQPVVNVSWRDAQQYLAWLSRRTGQRYRLLSQLEFHYAARAGASSAFPWGDRVDAGAANCQGCGGRSSNRALPVGSFTPNAWGLHDMMGNVSEFVADCYGPRSRASGSVAGWEAWVRLPEQARDGRPIDQCSAAPGRAAVSDPVYGVAGGRFDFGLSGGVLFTQWIDPAYLGNHIGLRVAREFTPTVPVPDAAALTPFRDCADCPELVNLPAGRFEMGTPYLSEQGWHENETPLRWVSVPAFAIGRHEVTRAQWAQFQRERVMALPVGTEPVAIVAAALAAASAPSAASAAPPSAPPAPTPAAPPPAAPPAAPAAAPPAACQVPVVEGDALQLRAQPGRDWADPGFPQGDDHPVACVSRAEAEAYVEWLSQRTGQRYRLPTEAEWEYAARAGSAERRPWRNPADACALANLRDTQFRQVFAPREPNLACNDGAAATAPVGRRQPNAWGLFDMLGNVAEHVADCWGAYGNAPSDGSAAQRPNCGFTVVRGGSWYSHPNSVVPTHPGRQSAQRQQPVSTQGLRVVRELAPAAGAGR